jgi:hypothetical protein
VFVEVNGWGQGYAVVGWRGCSVFELPGDEVVDEVRQAASARR